VERLQRTLAAAEAGPTLFLIDEIFSGTNSTDRRVAAEAVLERLLAHGAIGALSTHDLALTELATVESRGMNVHMASPDAEDPLGFDYRLKPGVNPSSNALAMIRMMGIEARG
jgi:DNA mismatch repair ATPase MutS